MSKNLSAKYYREKLQKKLMKDIKTFLKKKNMVVNIKNFFQKMKNKSLLSIEKKINRMRKMPYYNYKQLLL